MEKTICPKAKRSHHHTLAAARTSIVFGLRRLLASKLLPRRLEIDIDDGVRLRLVASEWRRTARAVLRLRRCPPRPNRLPLVFRRWVERATKRGLLPFLLRNPIHRPPKFVHLDVIVARWPVLRVVPPERARSLQTPGLIA
jgi:hypothetical protein